MLGNKLIFFVSQINSCIFWALKQPRFEASEAQGSRVERPKIERNFFENCFFSALKSKNFEKNYKIYAKF